MKAGALTAALQMLFAPASFAQLNTRLHQVTQPVDIPIDFAEITRRESQHKRKRTRKRTSR